MDTLLEVDGLCKTFVKRTMLGRSAPVLAVDDVSFHISEGESFVLAGESGSGKSTVARLILGALVPDAGTVSFGGQKTSYDRRGLSKIRRGCQMVPQNPYDSINPRMTVSSIVAEPLEIHRVPDKSGRVREALLEVKLDPDLVSSKHPHMLSGGQRQRVVLARALAVRPKLIIADEPVSMLDVSIRAEMLELMSALRKRHNIAFLYITHDLATARFFGNQIGILYRGRIVEMGDISRVLLSPNHPYTAALVEAISEPDPSNRLRRKRIPVRDPPEPFRGGCAFRGRCPLAIPECADVPPLQGRNGRLVACHVDTG